VSAAVARCPCMEAHPLVQGDHLVAPVRESRAEAVARRALDLIVATTLIVILSPVLLAIAIAIRLDSPGPALFRQRRVGIGQREFTLFKFRSMRADADPTAHKEYVSALIAGDGERTANEEDEGEGLYKLVGDRRVTRVGETIRRWSADELPQLFNVVLGDMSLVGPRPTTSYEVDEYPAWYFDRFSVKPGLTGLWQVSGRNERTYEEMVRIDIEYVETRNLRLDLSILVRTPWVVLSRKGAA
jgi:lipopolysaccharide/colanic/teichoic acid biosynthesis glycosyltransferase